MSRGVGTKTFSIKYLEKKSAALWTDMLFNELAKIVVGSLLFLGYYMYYYQKTGAFMQDLGTIVLASTLSTILGYVLGYCITRIAFRSKANRGFMSYNSILDGETVIREVLLILVNSSLSLIFFLDWLKELSEQMIETSGVTLVLSSFIPNIEMWFLFLGLWFLYKIVLSMLVYIFTKQAVKNILCILLIFGLYGGFLMIVFL
jgi:hypothetical protein